MQVRTVLVASVLWISVLSAEIGNFRGIGTDEEDRTFGWRQKRFIVQFQVPSTVGHFRVSMLPPYLQRLMSHIPGMIRRSFLFGGHKDPPTTLPPEDTDSDSSDGHYQRLYY